MVLESYNSNPYASFLIHHTRLVEVQRQFLEGIRVLHHLCWDQSEKIGTKNKIKVGKKGLIKIKHE